MSELLPCPFCGGTDIREDVNLRKEFAEVFCDDCGATITDEHKSADARDCWNRRTPAPVVQAGEAVPVGWIKPGTLQQLAKRDPEAEYEIFATEGGFATIPLYASPSPREEEMRREIEGLSETLAAALDEWEGHNGRLTDPDDPHWSNDAIKLLAALDKDSSHE